MPSSRSPPSAVLVVRGDEDASFPVEDLARRALRPRRPDLAAVFELTRHEAAPPIGADQVVLADVAFARAGDLHAISCRSRSRRRYTLSSRVSSFHR